MIFSLSPSFSLPLGTFVLAAFFFKRKKTEDSVGVVSLIERTKIAARIGTAKQPIARINMIGSLLVFRLKKTHNHTHT